MDSQSEHLPSLVFVHGSWHSPKHFEPITQVLASHGYNCVNIGLPSTQTPDTPPARLSDDTRAVRTAVETELAAGRNVVVVAHSYGGTPANNALQTFDEISRLSAGKSTFVKAIAFINAIPIPAGGSFLEVIGGKPGPLHDLRTPDFAWVGAPGGEHYFYNEMEPGEAKYWASLLRQQSWAAYEDRTSYAAYMDIPCWYLSCANDQAFPCAAQSGWIGSLIDSGAKIQIVESEGDHTPFLGRLLGKTSRFIEQVAKGDVQIDQVGA